MTFPLGSRLASCTSYLSPPQGFRTHAKGSVQFPTLYYPPALIKVTGEIFTKHLLSTTLDQRPLLLIGECMCFTGDSLPSREGVEAAVNPLGRLHGLQVFLPLLVAPLSPFPHLLCEPQVFYFFAERLITCVSSVDLRGTGFDHLLNSA